MQESDFEEGGLFEDFDPPPRHCQARRVQDQMICGACALQWDVDDEERPACRLAGGAA